MKIALYKAYGSEQIYEASAWHEESESYIRLTEIVDVELPRLPPEITVPQELASIDSAKAELRNKFNEKLSELNIRRANLLALTHQVLA